MALHAVIQHGVIQSRSLVVALLVWSGGCSSQGAGDAALLETEQGQLRLPLVTTQEDTFRLSQALFRIENVSGSTLLTLDSDLDPEASQLEAELAEGSYRSRLESGWLLQRIEDDGSAVTVNAALLTPNPTPFEIRSDRTTELNYTFSTEQGSVTLGEGQLLVTLDVTATPIPVECSPLNNFGNCPSGQVCLLAGDTGGTYCASPGTLPVGSECSSEQCVAGSQCLAVNADDPAQRACTRFCSVFNTEFGCNCIGVGSNDESLGVCGPLPAGACDLLTQTGCAPGEGCQHETGSFGSCGPSGTGSQGESCTQDTDCAAGFDCFQRFFDSSQCSAFCDSDEACRGFGSFCQFAGTGNIGRCT